jgi:hypothetical protein
VGFFLFPGAEFDEFKRVAASCDFYYEGPSQLGNEPFYTLCNQKDGIVAFVPMTVTSISEAKAAMIASAATYLVGAPPMPL